MRALLGAVVLLMSVSACALPAASTYPPTRSHPYEGLLRARLVPAVPGVVGFHVNQPAHVAVFEIDPRYGVTMLYPRFAGEAMAYAGTHTVVHSSSRYAGLRGRGAGWYPAFASGWGSRTLLQPRFYYLVASERPLRVAPYIGSSLALRAALGGSMYAANAYTLMDELAQLVVPAYASDDWVSDLYVEWPEPAYDEVRPTPTHIIRCGDGRRYEVPWYITSCPSDRPIAPPPVDSVAPPREGEEPRRPDRRRPERDNPQPPGDTRASPPPATRPERTRESPPEAGPTAREPRPVRPEGDGTPREPRPERTAEPRPERTRDGRPERSREGRLERGAEPRSAEPRSAEPRSAEPRPAPEPRATEPRSAPEPRREAPPAVRPAEPSAPPRAEPRAAPPSPPPATRPEPRSEPEARPSSSREGRSSTEPQ